MPYSYVSGPNGPEYTLKDDAAGDTFTTFQVDAKNGTFDGESIAGFPTPEPEEPVTQGHNTTTGNEGTEPQSATPASHYGKKTLTSRAYTISTPEKTIAGENSVRSAYNKWALHSYKNTVSGGDPDDYNKAVFAGAEQNVLNPTARKIVQYSVDNGTQAFDYNFKDFIQCEHYGQISNEYMITLRRFAYPVADDLLTMKDMDSGGKVIDVSQPDLSRAITWMSPALGNDMKEVLQFGTAFPWKKIESEIQTVNGSASQRGKLGSIMDGSSLGRAFEAGLNGYTAEQAAKKADRGAGWDPVSETYPNKVFGPLNVIKSVLAREQGLEFNSEFNLTFHYDLRGFPNTSPKVAFMDTLSNILALTYNNAPFWGGAVRYTSNGSLGKPFGDYDKLRSGDYAGFLGSLTTQLKSSMGAAFNDIGKAASGLLSGKGINALGDSKIMDQIVGGGLMKLMNGPQGGQTIKAFLTGDPTGQWHMTIGNPMNPMMVAGNLALESSKVEFEGPLGYEGFPSKIKLTVTLKPARPRDKAEIESMFNAGRGRIYLQPEVEGKGLDDIVDVSAYGNKDRGLNASFATRISDFSAG